MPVLKLYEQADPRRVLETRALRGGALTVGRDPGPFGWSLRDPERAISRSHFEIREAEGRVTVRDLSTNGLSLAGRRTPLPPGEEVDVELGEVLRGADDSGITARMDYRYPPGAVRRLDDTLLASFGQRYVDLHGNADRRTALTTRLQRLADG